MNYAKIEKCDVVNGPGIRTTLFVSGCTHACPSCHNKEAQNFRFGQKFTQQTLEELLEVCSDEFCSGLTLSGGDPLHPTNILDVAHIVKAFRYRFGNTKNIWCWTGYTLEGLRNRCDFAVSYLLENIDVLVDGPFVEALKDPALKWRGSSNQRILHYPFQ